MQEKANPVRSNRKGVGESAMGEGGKANCWEYMKCGREPGGNKADRLGVCPAAMHNRYDGINGGRNAGRCCWVVVGTFCDGKSQGVVGQKFEHCLTCPFYLKVEKQEGRSLTLNPVRWLEGKAVHRGY